MFAFLHHETEPHNLLQLHMYVHYAQKRTEVLTNCFQKKKENISKKM
jgi:hypothetical protein